MKILHQLLGSFALLGWVATGTGFAQKNDVRLIDQTPFDRVFLKVAEKGKDKQFDVFLLEGLSRRPVKLGEDEEKLVIRLINQPDQKYQVAWKHIEKVTLFEQLVLAEAERLRDAGEFDEAYEYFQYLVRASPKFPGVQRGLESCFMAEALHWEQKKELTQALVLLNQLYEVNSTYPDLHRAMGRITGTLVDRYIEANDGPAARGLLQELKTKSPQNAMLAGKAERLRTKADEAFQRAKQEKQQGKLRQSHESTETAYAWWPELQGVADFREQLHESYPLLRVGVRNLAPTRAARFPKLGVPSNTDPHHPSPLRTFDER